MYRLVQYTDFHSLVSCLIHSTNTSNKVGALAYAALIAARQVHLLLVWLVLLSQTFVRTVIWLVMVRSVWGLVQRGTCTVVGLWSNIGRVAWIVVVRPHSLSEQLVLPEPLLDSEEWVIGE